MASNSLSLSQVARPRARRAVRALGRTLGPHGRRAGQDSRGHLIERITGERAHLRLFCKGLNVILADVGFARDRFNPGLDLLLHLCARAYASAPALRATRAPVPRCLLGRGVVPPSVPARRDAAPGAGGAWRGVLGGGAGVRLPKSWSKLFFILW